MIGAISVLFWVVIALIGALAGMAFIQGVNSSH